MVFVLWFFFLILECCSILLLVNAGHKRNDMKDNLMFNLIFAVPDALNLSTFSAIHVYKFCLRPLEASNCLKSAFSYIEMCILLSVIY